LGPATNVSASADKPARLRENPLIPQVIPGTSVAQPIGVNIRFTSSLTAEDENQIAPALLTAMVSILNLLPIAYVLRIDTADASVFQHSGSPAEPPLSLSGLTNVAAASRRQAADTRKADWSALEPTNLVR
jgi:hypothetical protein